MNFTFLCLVITQYILYGAHATYNMDVTCVIDKGQEPECATQPKVGRRNMNSNLPSHDPYIPRSNGIIYSCTSLECNLMIPDSLTQIIDPALKLKLCYQYNKSEKHKCEHLRYNYLKNIDKLLFLQYYIPNKMFYSVDCLVYADGGRVCHRTDDVESSTKLIDMGILVRPNEANIYMQDEFICEESPEKEINCDLNTFIPHDSHLTVKEIPKIKGDILLKTGTFVVILGWNCIDRWCGFSGRLPHRFHLSPTRRQVSRYESPGGKVYRCYYAKRQQVCKELSVLDRRIYSQRGWENY